MCGYSGVPTRPSATASATFLPPTPNSAKSRWHVVAPGSWTFLCRPPGEAAAREPAENPTPARRAFGTSDDRMTIMTTLCSSRFVAIGGCRRFARRRRFPRSDEPWRYPIERTFASSTSRFRPITFTWSSRRMGARRSPKESRAWPGGVPERSTAPRSATGASGATDTTAVPCGRRVRCGRRSSTCCKTFGSTSARPP